MVGGVACLDKVEKRLNKSTREATDGGTMGAQPATNEVKNKGHIVRLGFLHNRTDILTWRQAFAWHQARPSQV